MPDWMVTMNEWPANWDQLTHGIGCSMCQGGRPDADPYGVCIQHGPFSDAYLQRKDIQRGYTVVIWRGRHVTEPTELTEDEARGYWAETLSVSRALLAFYQPLKMNYETLGNSLPHLHTHLIPRYPIDPRPGHPFPLMLDTDDEIPEARLRADAAELRQRLGWEG
jgi:diadenosine tetraphosphate (Ap4A) HIT family hydrolase